MSARHTSGFGLGQGPRSIRTGICLGIGLLAVATGSAQETDPGGGEAETGSLTETVVQSTPAPAPAAPATASRPSEPQIYTTTQPQVLVDPSPEVDINGMVEPVADVSQLPGSGYFVTANEIREQNYVNVNRVLARVPGVYFREEDGSGLFPNISVRGVDGTRSEKVTLMEDGILTAPATYAAPSAYYSPNIARMAGVEILKGSSQVRFGPHTTGGVVNYLSTPIPDERQFYLRNTYGTDSTMQLHAHYGDTLETKAGKFGYVAEFYYRDSDGFRDIDGGLTVPGGGDTGYQVIEPMIKLSWEPETVLDQRFEFKYGMSDIDADETYLGLTEADARANPYRRYAGSFADNIQTEHHRTYLKHQIDFNDSLSFEHAVYYNHFERDWFKIREVDGLPLHNVLADPVGNAGAFATLTGTAGGVLGYRHNARSYEAYGYQMETDYLIEGCRFDQTLTGGFRYHYDKIRRFQEDTDITTSLVAAPVFTDFGPGSGGNRLQEVDAYAFWLQNELDFGALSITPGLRFEHIDLHNTDFASDATNTVTADRRGDREILIPGVGFRYEFNDCHSLFGGIFKGASTPSPRAFLRDGAVFEESIGYELGFRHTSDNFNTEVVGFYTDFENILGQTAGLGQNQGTTTNAGEAEVWGFEFLASYDPWQGRALRLPLFASATYTSAQLTGEPLAAGGGEDIYGDGDGGAGIPGAELPYIPEWKLAFGAGLQTDCWGVDLNATYLSDTFGTALNSPVVVTSSRQGLVDGGWIVDLGGHLAVTDRINMVAGVHNLFDRAMITSRIPEGPRNGAPRQGYVGFEIISGR